MAVKIIAASNFDIDTVDDELIADNVDERYAVLIADALNQKYSSGRSMMWFRVVPTDYNLHVFKP